MTRQRNLGPVLALAGAGIALAAVIAGFLLVGGPGDARDKRLDEATEDRIADAVRMAQCAYYITGAAPAAFEEARATPVDGREWNLPIVCNSFNEDSGRKSARTAAQPESPGDVTYQATDNDSIRVCGNFRRPADMADEERYSRGRGDVLALFPSLREDRPQAGVHCYAIDLLENPSDDDVTVSN